MTVYEPGTVAVATVRGVPNVRIARTTDNLPWIRLDAARYDRGSLWLTEQDVTDVRPLIVLDLDGIGTPRQVVEVLRWDDSVPFATMRSIADQIEAQSKPPRISEPKPIGSRVLAAQFGEVEGSEHNWTKFRNDGWIDTLGHIRSWSDLDNPVHIGIEDGAS